MWIVAGIHFLYFSFFPLSRFCLDNNNTDNDDGKQATVWMRVVAIGHTLFSGCYSSFLICGGSIFGNLTRKVDVVVWGCRSSFAAGGIVLFQVLAIGVRLFYGLQLVGTDTHWQFEEKSFVLVQTMLGYATVMTYFFLHNLVFALLPAKQTAKNLADTDDDSNSSDNDSDGELTPTERDANTKSILLLAAAEEGQQTSQDYRSRTQSRSYCDSATYFRSRSLCSTSFDSKTGITDFCTSGESFF